MPIDAKALSARIKAAPPSEQRAIWTRFRQWIFEGAKAQGNLGTVGVLLIASGIGVPWIWYASPYPIPGPWIFLCVLPVAIGVLAFREASRRETAWRERNPFEF